MTVSLVRPLETTESLVPAAASTIDRGGDSSAAKVLAILDAFSGPKAVLGVTELAQGVGIPKSTAHRLLAIMIEGGFVCKVGTRYCLTERMFEVGNRGGSGAVRASGLRRRAMPYLTELYAGTRETVHLAMLVGDEILYLEKLFGHGGVRSSTSVGTRRPAHATALGKAMLAYSPVAVRDGLLRSPLRRFTPRTLTDPVALDREFERIREDGAAFDNGELRPEMHCVAVPVFDSSSGLPIAAVSICSLRPQAMKRHTVLLAEVARGLARAASA